MIEQLPEEDCRYCVVDLDYKTDDGRPQDKLLFVNWAPDSAPIKSKMVYASTKESFKRNLVGIAKELQATDMSECDREAAVKLFGGVP